MKRVVNSALHIGIQSLHTEALFLLSTKVKQQSCHGEEKFNNERGQKVKTSLIERLEYERPLKINDRNGSFSMKASVPVKYYLKSWSDMPLNWSEVGLVLIIDLWKGGVPKIVFILLP